MKTDRGFGCAALLVALLLGLALDQPAFALSQLTWERIDVDAHLLNTGALHVSEWMSVRVVGNMTMLDRRVATSTDQAIVLRRLVREEGGEERELAGGGFDQKDRYMWRDQTLTWWMKDATEPEWRGQTLVYRFEYELRNALAPAWDIPAGTDPLLYSRDTFPRFFARLGATMAARWQAPASIVRRYRLDHDVIFPRFAETEMKEFRYTLRYDDAWRMVHPEAEIGRATPGSDYRVTQLLDRLAPGWPPAIDLWRPATRVGSIFGFAALAALLWATFAAGAIRRWGLIPPRLDHRWFAEHVGSRGPEMVARVLGRGGMPRFVAPFLGRLCASGVIAVRSEPAAHRESGRTIHLQLLRDPATLQPHERLMMGALFPQGPASGSALLDRYYAKPGFNPEKALAEAIDHDLEQSEEAEHAEPPGRSSFWRLVRRLSPWVCWSAAALLLLDAFHAQPPMALILTSFPLVFVVAFLPQFIFRFETPSSGGIAALVTLVPVIVAAMTVVSMHLFENVPLTAPGSAGLALVAVWSVGALLYGAQDVERSARARQKRIAVLGARYARRELGKPQPRLDDTWIPHLAALGLEPQVASWRERHAAAGPIKTARPVSAGPGFEAARPFTGIAPFPAEEGWVYALYVPSEKEREEEEAGESR